MWRVASLKDMVHAKYTKPDIAGMIPSQQLEAIQAKTQQLVQQMYSTSNTPLHTLFRQKGLRLTTSQ